MTSASRALPAHVRRILDLATADPQLQELMPDDMVEAVLGEPEISFEKAVTTVLEAYADRPALGERDHGIELYRSGRRIRGLGPAFRTITYRELGRRITGSRTPGGTTRSTASTRETSCARSARPASTSRPSTWPAPTPMR